MLAKNKTGWIVLEYLKIKEDEIFDFENVTGAFAIVNVNGKYLIGYNRWRKQWEFPAGGIEKGETAKKAAMRELYEETHQTVSDMEFRGLFKVMKPDGRVVYQAVYMSFCHELEPFIPIDKDEMEDIRLWDLQENIGYVDECDLKMVEMACL